MTALLPNRVSIYDFLIIDSKPIDSIIADMGNISLPQARLVIENSIQAIISGVLAYKQFYGAKAVLTKLLRAYHVKELRTFNAFNFQTMSVAKKHGHQTINELFDVSETQIKIHNYLAKLTNLPIETVKPLLEALSLLCLRELAILTDFAKLDATEINDWLRLQHQFLSLPRDFYINTCANNISETNIYKIPTYNQNWHSLTGYTPPKIVARKTIESLPHYAKVIGRMPITMPINIDNKQANSLPILSDIDNTNPEALSKIVESGIPLIIDKTNDSDVLTFAHINGISLPYQRWLLQLAKIADIYLSRNRLKIAPEPAKPPARPLVNFDFLDSTFKKDLSKQLNTVNGTQTVLWKNPTLIILAIVIIILALLALIKYQYVKRQDTVKVDVVSENVVDSDTFGQKTASH